MKALLVANTVITTKEQAKNLIKRLNSLFLEDTSIGMTLAIDDYTERLVSAGFLSWEDAEELEIEAYKTA